MATRTKGPKGVRDSQGRFVRGHKSPGPGNPHAQRIREYNGAIRKAVSVGDLERLLTRLLKRAEQGDMAAAKLVLDRVLGKVGQGAATGGIPTLGECDLTSLAGVTAALQRIVEGVASGELPSDQAAHTAGIVELARRAIETEDLERRICDLEQVQ